MHANCVPVLHAEVKIGGTAIPEFTWEEAETRYKGQEKLRRECMNEATKIAGTTGAATDDVVLESLGRRFRYFPHAEPC